jgi:TolB protein
LNTFRTSRIIRIVVIIAACAAIAPRPVSAQDWFKTGTGLGVEKARLAVPEFAARSAQGEPLEKVFHDVLWKDLEFCGILDLVSPSFYPTQVPSQPGELKATDWSQAPANAYMVAFGNLTADGSGLAASGYLFDVHNPTAPPVLQKVYRGAVTEADARKLAHQFADDIVARLSGGLPGIANTQLAFVSARTGNKEIWVMDYDGGNQHQVTHLRSIALTPRWSPDSNRIAFTC